MLINRDQGANHLNGHYREIHRPGLRDDQVDQEDDRCCRLILFVTALVLSMGLTYYKLDASCVAWNEKMDKIEDEGRTSLVACDEAVSLAQHNLRQLESLEVGGKELSDEVVRNCESNSFQSNDNQICRQSKEKLHEHQQTVDKAASVYREAEKRARKACDKAVKKSSETAARRERRPSFFCGRKLLNYQR